jgi:Flp pilus assembly protein TadG
MFYAVMLFFVVAVVGLAVDAGTIYMIKARLSSAVDAAALAAGRSVNVTENLGAAQSAATTTAQQFFAANFPTGYFNTGPNAPTVTPTLTEQTDGNGNPNGVINIQVNASVAAPTYFMNIFNISNVTVNATGTASRRDLIMMLVLDTSASMNTATTPTACQAMVTAAQNFITLLSPYDEVGLIEFNLTATMKDSPTTNHTQVSNDIANITCGSNTNTTSALELAYEQIQQAAVPLALNTIVLFTDGSPNGITATFPARAVSDTRYGPAVPNPASPASCANTGATDANGDNENTLCVMVPICTSSSTAYGASGTIYGTISQGSGQDSYGGNTFGFGSPTSGVLAGYLPSGANAPDSMNLSTSTCSWSNTAPPAATAPLSASNNPGNATERQFVAYIPDTDAYGNSLHGVAATGTSPYGSVSGGMETRDFWLFQTNPECSPDPTVVPNCKNTGGPWTAGLGIGTGSNKFTSGAYSGQFRPDQPNTIVAASMNGAMAEAYRIRSDATYHVVIDTIYLTGNGTDSVDHEFLAVVANAPQVTPLPYDAAGTAPYANPAYQVNQQSGLYLVTSSSSALASLFAQVASEFLTLSH